MIVKEQAAAFWEAKDDADAKRLIGPMKWGSPPHVYMGELFDGDPKCNAFFCTFPPKKPDVLEIGCGQGRILHGIAPLFERTYGVDISDSMLKLAEAYLSGTGVSLGKIVDSRFPLKDKCVDVVFSTIVFQHIQDRETILAYLRESRRVLRPGGIIRVQTHIGSPPPPGVFGGFHGHFYPSVEAFAAEFTAAGLTVVTKQTGIGHPDWLWVTAVRPADAVVPAPISSAPPPEPARVPVPAHEPVAPALEPNPEPSVTESKAKKKTKR
jgi:SAM-dependent methyltransferase